MFLSTIALSAVLGRTLAVKATMVSNSIFQ